jgi:hypothetical protein
MNNLSLLFIGVMAFIAASAMTPWQLFQSLCPYFSSQSPECALLQQQQPLLQQPLQQQPLQQQPLQQQPLQQQPLQQQPVPSTTLPFTSPQIVPPSTFTPTTP